MTDWEYLTEEEAGRLWHRAAELQAEAARRAESLVVADAETEGRAEGDPSGYALTHVKTAAVEAGISEEFVDAALADLRAERAASAPGGRRLFAHVLLRDPPEAITVRKVIRADAKGVFAAMEAVLPAEPYRLTLADRKGDPLRGGVLVFDIQGAGFMSHDEGFAGDAAYADFRQVYATLRTIAGPEPSCEVTLRCPIGWAQNLNAGLGSIMIAMGGGAGLFLGFAVGAAVAPVAGPVAAALIAGGSGGAGGAAGLWGIRAMHRYGVRRGSRAVEGMASAIALRAEGGWGLAGP